MRPVGSRVHVRVPATSANLGPGFDCLGLALRLHDEVTFEVLSEGLVVEVVGEGAGDLPLDRTHLVVRAFDAACDLVDRRPPGLRLWCRNRIPQSRGLGSSAAAVVAGVLAARALVGTDGLDDPTVLALAARIEGHADNVAACLLGGLTVAWTAGDACALRLSVAPTVAPVLLVPATTSATVAARALLPSHVPHVDAAANAARAALLVAALTARPDLLFAATEDLLHQQYRATAMPATADLVRHLRTEGVAAVVSGSGPSVLVLTTDSSAAEVGAHAPPGWAVHRLEVDDEGATSRTVPEAPECGALV